MKPLSPGRRPRTLAPAAPRARLGLLLWAWFAQLCLPILAHAMPMAGPSSPSSWWCGDKAGAAEMWATLPDEIRAGLAAASDTDSDNAAHAAVCSQLCALGTAPALPAAATPTHVPMAVAQHHLSAWADPAPRHRFALSPPAQGPPSSARS